MAKKKDSVIAEVRLPNGKVLQRECKNVAEAKRVIQFWINEMKQAGIQMTEIHMLDERKGKSVVIH